MVSGNRFVMDVVWNILRGVETKRLVPIVMIEVHLHGIGGFDGLEFIIKDNMVLRSDLPSSEIQHEWNGVTVLDTVADVDTSGRPWLPTWKLETT
jgi:hypothetical protein